MLNLVKKKIQFLFLDLNCRGQQKFLQIHTLVYFDFSDDNLPYCSQVISGVGVLRRVNKFKQTNKISRISFQTSIIKPNIQRVELLLESISF